MIIKWEFIKKIFAKKISSINEIRIKKDNFIKNYLILKSIKPNIIPVLKSNAYGFGIKQVCSIIKNLDIKIVAVDSIVEYFKVIKYLKSDILIMGETIKENYKLFDFKKTHFCVYNLETIDYLIGLNKKIKIHIFINSGMNREGIQEKNLSQIIKKIKDSKLVLEGVCTHFSSLDAFSGETEKEINIFLKNIEYTKKHFDNIKYIHVGGGNAILKINSEIINYYRVGLLFYGYTCLDEKDESIKKLNLLENTLGVYSKITSIQEIKTGEGVSYNLTFKADKNTKIATIPFGYFEGLSRKLSNNLKVKIKGKYYNLVGRVCMNYICVDIGTDDISLFDEVEIISLNKNDINSIGSITKLQDTINYEILVKLNNEIKRVII